jgi:hypothetical protein
VCSKSSTPTKPSRRVGTFSGPFPTLSHLAIDVVVVGSLLFFFLSITCRTVVGVKCVDGVVLGVEKLITSKMLVPGSDRRIMNVDLHCGVVCMRCN